MKLLLLSASFMLGRFLCFAQPANDNPCGAINLPANSTCVSTAGTLVASTNTAGIPAPGCASYSGPDVWYSVVVPASGAIMVTTSPGTVTDGGMAVYSAATCAGPFTLISCDDDSGPGAMSSITATGLTPASTVYVRVWQYSGGTGTFSICALASTVCGGAANNDYCPFPAILTQGPGTFSATTDVTFTQDQPGNLTAVFCGTIENNSWYRFIATATSHSFPITSVTGCVSNFGIQAQVYQVTTNGSGCCTNFASVSNCYNPGNTTLGTVNATGLTIGNPYYLMIDGNGGDGCEFSISGWTATGILPVELSAFSGISEEYGNELTWTTESEYNNDFFEVMYSRDAYHFEKIGTIQGAGTTNNKQNYQFIHQGIDDGTNYYKLVQVNTDGERTDSKIIAIQSKVSNGLFKAYPNPAKNELVLEFQSAKKEMISFSILDIKGMEVRSEEFEINEGFTNLFKDVSGLTAGVYTLIIRTANSTHIERIIKID